MVGPSRRAPFWASWGWRLIGAILLAVIVWHVGVSEILRTLLNVHPLPVVAAVLASTGMLVLRAVRWRVVCSGLGIRLGMLEALRLYLLGTFVGAATPGRVGDLVKAFYIRHHRPTGGLAAGIASVVYDRLLDLGQIGALALGAVVLVPGVPPVVGPSIVALALAAFVFSTSWSPTREGLLARALDWALVRLPGGDGVSPPALSAQHSTLAQLLTAGALALFAGETVILARGLGIMGPSFWDLSVLAALGALVGLAPITIFGVGTRDALFVAAAPVLDEPSEALLGLSLLMLGLYVLSGVLGWAAWVLSPPAERRPPEP